MGAHNELKVLDGTKIQDFLLNKGCDFEFKFKVSSASHQGGVWEKQIKTVRSVLANILLNDMVHN